jgi:hypothetical protein
LPIKSDQPAKALFGGANVAHEVDTMEVKSPQTDPLRSDCEAALAEEHRLWRAIHDPELSATARVLAYARWRVAFKRLNDLASSARGGRAAGHPTQPAAPGVRPARADSAAVIRDTQQQDPLWRGTSQFHDQPGRVRMLQHIAQRFLEDLDEMVGRHAHKHIVGNVVLHPPGSFPSA